MRWWTRGPTLPKTLGQLSVWLRDTDAGREILRRCYEQALEEKCSACEKGIPIPRVLVVLRRLGHYPGVEVYRETGVNLRLEELVDSEDDPAVELLIDDLLRAQLPQNWKHMVDCRCDSIVFTGLTAGRRIDGR